MLAGIFDKIAILKDFEVLNLDCKLIILKIYYLVPSRKQWESYGCVAATGSVDLDVYDVSNMKVRYCRRENMLCSAEREAMSKLKYEIFYS